MPLITSKQKSWLLLAVAAVAAIWLNVTSNNSSSIEMPADVHVIEKAFKDHKSDIVVEGVGTIRAILKDDTTGSRHQRIIVVLDSGHSLLIAHNIDLAARIDNPRKGAKISFKGEYEWNVRGGVIHWTHKDSEGSHPAGWLMYDGKKYW